MMPDNRFSIDEMCVVFLLTDVRKTQDANKTNCKRTMSGFILAHDFLPAKYLHLTIFVLY